MALELDSMDTFRLTSGIEVRHRQPLCLCVMCPDLEFLTLCKLSDDEQTSSLRICFFVFHNSASHNLYWRYHPHKATYRWTDAYLLFVSVPPLTETRHVCWRNMSSAYLLCFFCYSLQTHAHSPTAADSIDRVIVKSVAYVEKCLLKVRTASGNEDKDTQDSLEFLKAPLCARWIVCVLCVLYRLNRCYWLCVSLYPCLCVFCICVDVNACLCVWVHMHQRESRGSGVCLVPR